MSGFCVRYFQYFSIYLCASVWLRFGEEDQSVGSLPRSDKLYIWETTSDPSIFVSFPSGGKSPTWRKRLIVSPRQDRTGLPTKDSPSARRCEMEERRGYDFPFCTPLLLFFLIRFRSLAHRTYIWSALRLDSTPLLCPAPLLDVPSNTCSFSSVLFFMSLQFLRISFLLSLFSPCFPRPFLDIIPVVSRSLS